MELREIGEGKVRRPCKYTSPNALDAQICLAGCNNAHADGRNAMHVPTLALSAHSPLARVTLSLAPRTAISIVISEGGGGVLKMQGMRLRVNA